MSLVWRQQRRRIVVRHHSSGLESLVLVCEGRPGSEPSPPPQPLVLIPSSQGSHQQCWTLEQQPLVKATTMATRPTGQAESVTLRWQPEPGVELELSRSYSEYGVLQALEP